jgi:hypothetical protein
MTSTLRALMIVAAAGCVLTATSAQAQRRMGMAGDMPRYDASTEVTVRGVVQEVRQMTGRMDTMQGTHVILETDTGTVEVHLGPASYLEERKVTVKVGDTLDATGSRVTHMGRRDVLAREITVGGRTVALRDAAGVPNWSRGRGRP